MFDYFGRDHAVERRLLRKQGAGIVLNAKAVEPESRPGCARDGHPLGVVFDAHHVKSSLGELARQRAVATPQIEHPPDTQADQHRLNRRAQIVAARWPTRCVPAVDLKPIIVIHAVSLRFQAIAWTEPLRCGDGLFTGPGRCLLAA